MTAREAPTVVPSFCIVGRVFGNYDMNLILLIIVTVTLVIIVIIKVKILCYSVILIIE